MRQNVQSPTSELFVFILLFTDNNRRYRLFHPRQAPPQVRLILFILSGIKFRFDRSRLFLPVLDYQIVHFNARQLVDANEHRLAVFPRRGIVTDKITSNMVETFSRRYDVIVALQL